MVIDDTKALSNPIQQPRLAGILLAAGTSQRLRTTAARKDTQHNFDSTQKRIRYTLKSSRVVVKQLLDFHGRPLLEHMIEVIAQAKLDELVVVLGHEAEAIKKAVRLPNVARSPTHLSLQVDSPTENKTFPHATPHDISMNPSPKYDEIIRTQFCPVRFVYNPDYACGQSGSLRAGLRALSSDVQAAAIFLGDQPDLETATINQLIENFFCLCAAQSKMQNTMQCDTELAPLILRPLYTGLDDTSNRVGSTLVATPGHPVFFTRTVWEDREALQKLKGDQGARAIFASRPEWLHEVRIPGPVPRDIDTWEDYQRAVDAVSWPDDNHKQ